jgi:hypothetical protein
VLPGPPSGLLPETRRTGKHGEEALSHHPLAVDKQYGLVPASGEREITMHTCKGCTLMPGQPRSTQRSLQMIMTASNENHRTVIS